MKALKTIALFSVLALAGLSAGAQQDAQFSMYMFNPLAANPGYAGSRDALSITVLNRSQWVKFKGAPTTQTVSIHSPLKNDNLALGFSLVNDKIGANKNTGFYGDFAYRIKLNKAGDRLSFGLKGGLDLYSSDFSTLVVNDATDNLLSTPASNVPLPNFGFGMYYYGKRHYLGITAPKLLANKLGDANTPIVSTQEKHLFLIAGYVFKLSSTIDFKPSITTKITPAAPISMDVNASFLFYDKLWLGAMYRLNDSFGANIVYNISDKFRVGYAYDYTTTDIRSYSSGTHEIMLGFDLKTGSRSFKTPRYF